MSIKHMVMLALAAAIMGVVSTASAAPASAQDRCVFEDYAPLSVAPYHEDENYGMGTYTRLGGAQVYVAAQPGLTAEWLTLRVQQEFAKLSAADSCRPSVRDARVSVVSAGGGFWVAITADNERDAESLLSWAQSIVPGAR